MGILPVIDIIGKLADKIIPDPAERHQFELELAKIADQESQREHEEVMGQISTNNIEAANTSMFVSGWRPFVGWVCGVAVSYSFIIEPFAKFVALKDGYTGTFPVLDTSNLMTLMMGMLGMGYLRTKEKLSGVPDSQPVGKPNAPIASPAPKKKVLGIPWPF